MKKTNARREIGIAAILTCLFLVIFIVPKVLAKVEIQTDVVNSAPEILSLQTYESYISEQEKIQSSVFGICKNKDTVVYIEAKLQDKNTYLDITKDAEITLTSSFIDENGQQAFLVEKPQAFELLSTDEKLQATYLYALVLGDDALLTDYTINFIAEDAHKEKTAGALTFSLEDKCSVSSQPKLSVKEIKKLAEIEELPSVAIQDATSEIIEKIKEDKKRKGENPDEESYQIIRRETERVLQTMTEGYVSQQEVEKIIIQNDVKGVVRSIGNDSMCLLIIAILILLWMHALVLYSYEKKLNKLYQQGNSYNMQMRRL